MQQLPNDERELMRTVEEVHGVSRRAIRGVPVFVFNGRGALVGAQPAEVFREAIEKA